MEHLNLPNQHKNSHGLLQRKGASPFGFKDMSMETETTTSSEWRENNGYYGKK